MSEFRQWLRGLLRHWIVLLGGGAVALAQYLYSLWNPSTPPLFTLLILAACLFAAAFFAWRDEYRKCLTLEDRMRSKIRVSCGKSVEKSVVPVAGETWYRARLDLEGVAAIPDIEVTMIELRQDGQKVPLHEVLVLTMYPGMTNPYPIDKNLKTLGEGSPEFVDVVRVQVNGTAIFPLKFYPRAITPEGMLPSGHTYQSSWQSVARPNRTDICTFEFEWTGNTQTSDIRLVSVTPPWPDL